ncbi:phosphotransferase [Anaeromicropila herbilytica]|uniref:Aminoglycoside phosphotransferase n=1 Tax=Anaeromicropila herbilytica TaxID=2785025 RepID=A0A7R7ICJ3_9FIRM|nr:phosphotransferase [Anaeromicropila herbilytica]BCN30813.1 aminoglycoside phosphotransferase [Anaeromicropila herbilytica]
MEIIGVGNTAEIIAYEEGKVCKLFFEGYCSSAIEKEYKNSKLMSKMNLPVPNAYDIIHINDRIGIIYDRLYGETVLEKILRNENIEYQIKNIVDVHKNILKCHTNEGIYYKDFLKQLISDETDESKKLYNKIDELPDGDNLCHGDFHPGNVWINLQGTTLIIDFMNVCYGPWLYDVARTYFLIAKGSLPDNIPNREEIEIMQKQLADLYISFMNVNIDEISQYLTVIEACRNYE